LSHDTPRTEFEFEPVVLDADRGIALIKVRATASGTEWPIDSEIGATFSEARTA
jgi:hypothetical protein